jgi:hypothetical protein
VGERKDLDAALEFASYVQWSGLIDLCKANAQPEPLKVDGAFLEWKVKDLQRECREQFKSPNASPRIHKAELESINEKLDLIAERLAQVSPDRRRSDSDGLPYLGR